MKAMLATDMKPSRWAAYMTDDAWVTEPKYNGIRTLVHVDDGSVSWRNRNDEPLTKRTPSRLTEALTKLPGKLIIDGELLDGKLFAFDLPLLGSPLLNTTDERRREALVEVAQLLGHPYLQVAERSVGRHEKKAMADRSLKDHWEGVMFKDVNGLYHPGKRSELMVKLKFTRTIDCLAGHRALKGKNNVTLYLRKPDGEWTQVGACSLEGKEEVGPGDVLEVRFLYLGATGRLVQPRMLRKRTDKKPSECSIEQLDGSHVQAQPVR